MIKKLKKIFQYNEKKQIEKINELVENANNGSGGGGGKTVVLDLWDNFTDITTNDEEGNYIFTQEGINYVCEQTKCRTIDDFYNFFVNANLIIKLPLLEQMLFKFNSCMTDRYVNNTFVTFVTQLLLGPILAQLEFSVEGNNDTIEEMRINSKMINIPTN